MPVLEEVGEEGEEGAGNIAHPKTVNGRKRAKTKSRRKKSKSEDESCPLGAFAVLGLAVAIILFGMRSLSSVVDRKSNSCKMTMSRPIYVPLSVPSYDNESVPRGSAIDGYGYRLVRYLDGKLPVQYRPNPAKPRGTPVLFVPGHLGSYKQARSLGSIAAEGKTLPTRARLDIFALDLAEEWTAVHASIVWRQADFFNHAVKAILSLYEGDDSVPATSVMVVGHSLGGLVARAAFTLSSHRTGAISDIITLGTPHRRAIWMMDYSVLSLYRRLDSLWMCHSPVASTSLLSRCRTRSTSPEALVTLPGSEETRTETFEGEGDSADPVVPTGSGDGSDEACLAADDNAVPNGDCSEPALDDAENHRQGGPSQLANDSSVEEADAEGEAAKTGDGAVGIKDLLGNTVLLSISGGTRDTLMVPSLCVTAGLGLPGQSMAITTEAMNGCGIGVDHLALLWCKQVVKRVFFALSELQHLQSKGVDARERARVTSEMLGLSSSSTSSDRKGKARSDEKEAHLNGFEKAAVEGAAWSSVALSLLTHRLQSIIPMWVCLAGLMLAAAITRSLSASNSKHGGLPPVHHLLTPKAHFQWDAAKCGGALVWARARSKGPRGTVPLVACGFVLLARGVAETFPELVLVDTEHMFRSLSAVPGWAFMSKWAAILLYGAGAIARTMNPLGGIGDALCMPDKAIVAVYLVTAGAMILYVFVTSWIGAIGNKLLSLGLPRLVTSERILGCRRSVIGLACLAVIAPHIQKLTFPPSFRTLTLTGEASVLFMVLSLAVYGLLVSMIFFPAQSRSASTYQRLILVMYAPAPALLIGPQIAAKQFLLGRGGRHESFLAWEEVALASVALLPILGSVWLAHQARSFPSPGSMRGFLTELRAHLAEGGVQARGTSAGNGSNGGTRYNENSVVDLAVTALQHPHGHGACGRCLHPDGGRGSVFVETELERVSVGGGVTLGPGFRVVACDCPRREPAAPSSWCEFCRCLCEVCGGSKEAAKSFRRGMLSARRARRFGGHTGLDRDLEGASVAVGIISAVALYAGIWAFGVRIMGEPCHCLWGLSAVGTILCGMHWAATLV